MTLILPYASKLKQGLKAPASLGVEVFLLLGIGAIIGGLVMMGHQVASPYHRTVEISLSLWALPKYTTFSLIRGCAAYVLSLGFTLVYGTIAAHNRRAEKVMIPALDVLQSIPVLGFLPGLVLAMIRLFPTREIGLELACVVMIFTGQVWNMTFSYYSGIRSVPQPLWEAAKIYRMGRWRLFSVLELPANMIGLIWNSMMSMAGGWFFLIVNEAFRLGDDDYRLPGIGSYMNEAINQFDPRIAYTGQQFWRCPLVVTGLPVVAAIIAMIVMIVAVDQFFWRPIVAWSERFKLEESADADKPQSWMLSLVRQSRLFSWVRQQAIAMHRRQPIAASHSQAAPVGGTPMASVDALSVIAETRIRHDADAWAVRLRIIGWVITAILVVLSVFGIRALVRLLTALPMHEAHGEDWATVFGSLGISFLRTTAAVVVGGLWTLPAGILIGLSPKWSQRLQPVVQVVASFPAPMLFSMVTLAMLALGIPFNWGCVILMLLGAQWYILFNVIAGAMAIPGDLKEVGKLYRTPWPRQWVRLYVPCVFPYLVTGLITAAGGAWNATIVSEYVQVGTQTHVAYGLGALISIATSARAGVRDTPNYPLLAAGICTMALSVVIINRLFWKRLYRSAEGRFNLQS